MLCWIKSFNYPQATKYLDEMISLFTEKDNKAATLVLYEQLQSLGLPKGVTLSINNTKGAKSMVYTRNGEPVNLSLSNCYTMNDVVQELVSLLAKRDGVFEELDEDDPIIT